jgi:hypothetical protein
LNVKALLDPALKISEIGDRITVILVAAATETPIFNRSYPVNADAIQSLYAKSGRISSRLATCRRPPMRKGR